MNQKKTTKKPTSSTAIAVILTTIIITLLSRHSNAAESHFDTLIAHNIETERMSVVFVIVAIEIDQIAGLRLGIKLTEKAHRSPSGNPSAGHRARLSSLDQNQVAGEPSSPSRGYLFD